MHSSEAGLHTSPVDSDEEAERVSSNEEILRLGRMENTEKLLSAIMELEEHEPEMLAVLDGALNHKGRGISALGYIEDRDQAEALLSQLRQESDKARQQTIANQLAELANY